MDGNARCAKQRGSVASAGHEAGAKSFMELIRMCCQIGMEVDSLMSVFERVLKSVSEYFERQVIRVSSIGDTSRLPESLKRLIQNVEKTTRNNSRLHLVIAVNYSGRHDVVQACRSIADKVKNGIIQVEDVSDNTIEGELETSCCKFPCPDLLIRTSGEHRISNFLLWQLAYTELYFAEALWPDFGEAEFEEALASFQQRQRRYGGRSS